jgi:hypothetical protein
LAAFDNSRGSIGNWQDWEISKFMLPFPGRKESKGMRNVTKVLVVLAAVFCLAAASPAFADTFSWSYSGGTGTDTGGSGSLVANPNGTPGQFTILSISGMWDGTSISGLLGPSVCCQSPPNDNILYYPVPPASEFLDLGGLGLSFMAGSTYVNIYGVGGGAYDVLTAPNTYTCCSTAGTTLTSAGGSFNAVHTPEPMTLGLLGSGLVGLFLASKKRT